MSTPENATILSSSPPAKPARQASTSNKDANDPDRFKYGVLLRGKFIGVEDVKEETGDEVCQLSMIKLKAVVLAKKEHKQRICLKINLDGVEIVDEKTNQPIYKHAVNRISYIARDANDPRAIGYIYKSGNNSYQYFAIKTERQAQELFNTLKDLFEVVLQLRNASKKTDSNSENAPTTTTTETTTKTEEKTQDQTNTTANNNVSSGSNDLLGIETVQPVAQTLSQQSTSGSSSNILDDLADISSALPALVEAPKTQPIPAPSAQSSSNDLFGLFDSSAQTPASTPASGNNNQLLNNLSSLYSQPSPTPRLPPFPPQQQQPNYAALSNVNPFQSMQPPQVPPAINTQFMNTNMSPFASASPFQQQQQQQPPPLPPMSPQLNQFNSTSPLAQQFKPPQQPQPQQQQNTMQFPW